MTLITADVYQEGGAVEDRQADHIVAVAGGQAVEAGLPIAIAPAVAQDEGKEVIARATGCVAHAIAVEQVVADMAQQQVDTIAATEHIVAAVAAQQVIAAEAEHELGTAAAGERVVAVRTDFDGIAPAGGTIGRSILINRVLATDTD